jgi:predicted HTH transcriptional regulator
MVLKTAAAYLNSDGGTLLIGVGDEGEVCGIEQDLRLVNGNSLDQFQLLLMGFLTDRIGTEFIPFIEVSFEQIEGKSVCVLDVNRAPKPSFVDETKFYVRAGNATRELSMAKAIEYMKMRWPS